MVSNWSEKVGKWSKVRVFRDRTKNARAKCVFCAIFMKCLERMQIKIWDSILKFWCAHARGRRVRARLLTFFVDRTELTIMVDFWWLDYRRYDHDLIFTKCAWIHDTKLFYDLWWQMEGLTYKFDFSKRANKIVYGKIKKLNWTP